jgi:hypothetical protein
MYLKVVTDNETHYIKCGTEVAVKEGDVAKEFDYEAVLHLMVEKSHPNKRRVITLFPDLPTDEMGVPPRTLVTDGQVYLLDDSGRTVDVIQR